MRQSKGKRLCSAEKQELFSEMCTLLDAGLDFTRMFEVLTGDGEAPAYRTGILKEIYACVVGGDSLHDAMSKSGMFPEMDCSTVRIGESTGRLGFALAFLSDYYRKKEAQRKAIMSAVGYPLVVLCFAFVVLTFMMLVVIPMFSQVYYRMGQELPVLTRHVIAFSERFPLVAVVISVLSGAAAILFPLCRDTPAVMRLKSDAILHMPFVGRVARLEAQSNFCRMMSLLSGAGVPMLDALDMVSGSLALYGYRAALAEVLGNVRYGRSLADSLSAFPDLFGSKVCMMVRVGEESNRLPEMFSKAGDTLSESLDYSLKSLAAYIEPLLILIIGTIVSVILVSMYLPMFKMGAVITA